MGRSVNRASESFLATFDALTVCVNRASVLECRRCAEIMSGCNVWVSKRNMSGDERVEEHLVGISRASRFFPNIKAICF